MASSLQVALLEDNPIFRKGLHETINGMDSVSIVAEMTGTAGLESIAPDTTPDIFIVGVDMPTLESGNVIGSIKSKWPGAKVLVLSAYDHEFNIIRVLQKGANGYLSKRCDKKQLHKAILSVHYTGFYNESLPEIGQPWVNDDKAVAPFITEKELHFLRLLCSDTSYQDIADNMGLALHTIEGYRDILFQKLNVTSRVGLIVSAFLMGVAMPDMHVGS